MSKLAKKLSDYYYTAFSDGDAAAAYTNKQRSDIRCALRVLDQNNILNVHTETAVLEKVEQLARFFRFHHPVVERRRGADPCVGSNQTLASDRSSE